MRLRKNPPSSHFKLRPYESSERQSAEREGDGKVDFLFSLPCRKKKLKKGSVKRRMSCKAGVAIVVRVVEVVEVKEEEVEQETVSGVEMDLGRMEASQQKKDQNIKIEQPHAIRQQDQQASSQMECPSLFIWQRWRENRHICSSMVNSFSNLQQKDFPQGLHS